MGQKTALYSQHLDCGAKIVDFAGWDMPLHYGSQIQEHHAVRQSAGVFDVSHMSIFDVQGTGARDFLQRLLANNVATLTNKGQALYSCMLNERGGVIDDLIVYYLGTIGFRLVANAATHAKVLKWLEQHASDFRVGITDRSDLGMLAVQGPAARDKVLAVVRNGLRKTARELTPFSACWTENLFLARTGYTGEDGFELILGSDAITEWWRMLHETDVRPVGLGARDSLRLEAGMNLYGADMDDSTTPLEAGLSATVAWQPETRDFIGRAALEAQRDRGPTVTRVGLILQAKGVLRAGQKIDVDGRGQGIVTSGGFSPTLGKAIALGRIPPRSGEQVRVAIRERWLPARVTKPPFVRHGRSCIERLSDNK